MAGPGSILSTTVAGITLRNPVVLAAGTCGYVDELADVIDLTRSARSSPSPSPQAPARATPPGASSRPEPA